MKLKFYGLKTSIRYNPPLASSLVSRLITVVVRNIILERCHSYAPQVKQICLSSQCVENSNCFLEHPTANNSNVVELKTKDSGFMGGGEGQRERAYDFP